jgi:hypothetical protein
MALVRCDKHGNPKGKSKNNYVIGVEAVGHPETAAICGRDGCENPGLVWLNEQEHKDYKVGQRVFGFNTNVFKVKVK